MAELCDVTDTSFDRDVLGAEVPVLVDFWGEHCPPCRAIAPILKDLASRYAGRLRILRLDTDGNRSAMARYRVLALPTVLAFRDGQVVGQLTGAQPRKAFEEPIERALAG